MTTAKNIEEFVYDDLKIFYRKAGSGKPIIFLHNGGNSHVIWNRQLDYFAGRYTCYAFDLPGYGMSANPDARFSLKLYTNFLDEFITRKKLAPVTLVGNCIGSSTALTCAMQKPENVDKLILFNILTRATVWKGLYGTFFKLTGPVPSLRTRLRKWFGNWVPPRFVGAFSVNTQYGTRGGRDLVLSEELKKLYRQKGQLGALIDILADIESFAPMDEFEIPKKFPRTLVIWGEKNRILPLKAGRKLCEKLKPHRLEIIQGGGHVVMYELSQEINPIMNEFL